MFLKRFVTIFLLATIPALGVAQDFMSVREIRSGMMGVGKTVFSGSEIEDFEFEVLDIMPNFWAKRDLILVKLIGPKVEHTGVVAGMSGSPMYIDGRLIGALSYSLGIFQKDAIAGITPIHQMLEILDEEKVRSVEMAANRGFNAAYFEVAIGARTFDAQDLVPPQFKISQVGNRAVSEIVPLEIPLLFSGFEDKIIQQTAEFFNGYGLKARRGSGSFASMESQALGPLKPGSAYSLVIIDGDFGLQATGTVTYVDEEKVVGMGHPVLNSGAVALPMGKAKILTTLSSYMSSYKMAALTEVSGTIHQDRVTGVMGVTGEEPDLIPVKLSLTSSFRPSKEYNFRIAEDRSLHSLTPLLLNIVLNNALQSGRLSQANQTLRLEGQINLAKHKPVQLKNYYAGGLPSTFLRDVTEASGEISSIVGSLLSNSFEEPKIESVELNFEILPKKQIAIIDRIEINRTVVRPGDKVTVVAYLREHQGESQVVSHSLKIPEDVTASRIAVSVGSAGAITRLEYRTIPQKYRPRTFEQLVALLNNRRKNNFLFFQLRVSDKGVLIEGEESPSLPPSILSVMNSRRALGNFINLRYRTIAEESVQVDLSISGGRTIWLNVKPKVH